jgi:hypothetical protein
VPYILSFLDYRLGKNGPNLVGNKDGIEIARECWYNYRNISLVSSFRTLFIYPLGQKRAQEVVGDNQVWSLKFWIDKEGVLMSAMRDTMIQSCNKSVNASVSRKKYPASLYIVSVAMTKFYSFILVLINYFVAIRTGV